jgi:hypothetical protein
MILERLGPGGRDDRVCARSRAGVRRGQRYRSTGAAAFPASRTKMRPRLRWGYYTQGAAGVGRGRVDCNAGFGRRHVNIPSQRLLRR